MCFLWEKERIQKQGKIVIYTEVRLALNLWLSKRVPLARTLKGLPVLPFIRAFVSI